MSTRYLKNRRFNESLKNVAMWTYWRDTDLYAGATAKGAIYIEALLGTVVHCVDKLSGLNLIDESGWAWFIPLHEGLTSIGIVRHQAAYSQSAQLNGPRVLQSFPPSQTTPLVGSQDGCPTSSADFSSHSSSTNSLSGIHSFTLLLFRNDSCSAAEQRYLKALDLAPGVNQLLSSNGRMVRGEAELATVRTASDYSYSASSYAGEYFRIVGDAAGKYYCTASSASF